MKTAARQTVTPSFDVEEFAKEAARLTIVPPSDERPVWSWLNETGVAVWRVPPSDVAPEHLNHRTAFLLLHIDGVSTIRELVKSSGIPRQSALGILAALIDQGYIAIRDDGAVAENDAAPDCAGPASGICAVGTRIEGADLDDVDAFWDALALLS
jgi:hypothetical protein